MKAVQIGLAGVLLGLVLTGSAATQDAHESLGPKDTPSAKGKAPLLDLLGSVKASPKSELAGVHPRVYFTDAELAALGGKVGGTRLLVASEPARRRLSQSWFAAIGPLLGASRVTLHDARVSIAAGFLHEELPFAFGLRADRWKWKCEVSMLGAYRMIALRS